MVVINLHKNVIPVEIGSFKTEFINNDESIEKLQKLEKTFDRDELKNAKTFSEVRKLTKSVIDGIFGSGALEEVYALAGNSTNITMRAFAEACVELRKEIEDAAGVNEFAEYLED